MMYRLEQLLTYGIPPWLKRFCKQAGKGINQFGMIGDKDRILLGISGGKDSMAMALALSLRKQWLPINYQLHAAIIEWKEYPFPDKTREAFEHFFDLLGIPTTILQARMFSHSFEGEFNCYLCSRNRKRILFDEADRQNISKVALGHHLDDIVETTLINMCLRGKLDTMQPYQEFFDGKLAIIRPLCEVRESTIENVISRVELPRFVVPCPLKDTNVRSKMKPIVGELSSLNRYAREHIFRAYWNREE
jgi:tRNA 2-thiocytidine biosynthesis protein TtcA